MIAQAVITSPKTIPEINKPFKTGLDDNFTCLDFKTTPTVEAVRTPTPTKAITINQAYLKYLSISAKADDVVKLLDFKSVSSEITLL